uniref:RNA-directed DNA polymerase, eukaryota n=1 Tax=Tanacetum cinerariifolium TaxID=118510 RepID=A0A699J064_TANCI|nr:RNA-directed DNA polymerase, eukaryota [Tanacetum cinerariifolium]
MNVSFNNKWNEIAKLLGLAPEYQEAVKECYKEFIGMVKIYYEEAKRSKLAYYPIGCHCFFSFHDGEERSIRETFTGVAFNFCYEFSFRFQRGAKNNGLNVKNQAHLLKVHTSHSTSYNRSYVAAVLKELPQKQVGQSFNDKPVMVIREECFADKNLDFTLVVKVKNFESIPNLRVICKEEGFKNLTIRHLGGILSWFSVIQPWSSEFRVEDRVIWVDVKDIPSVAWTHNTFKKIAIKWGELLFVKDLNDNNMWCKRMCVITKIEEFIMETFKIVIKGTMSMIREREIIGWNPEFILDDDVSISEAEDSEDSEKSADPFNIYGLLNRPRKEVDKEKGISDDPSKPPGFRNVVEEVKNENSKGDNEVNGVECPQSNNLVTQEGARSVEENHHSKLNNGRHYMASNSRVDSSLPNGQCPHINSSLLEKINEFVEIGQAMGFTMEGCEQDIGKLFSRQELVNFNKQGAALFDSFIQSTCLIDFALGGYSFTWVLKDARKMSKLDIFFVSEGILCQFSGLSGSILSKHLSDHRPIMLKETSTDYGHIPSKIKSWVHQNRVLDNAKRKDVVKNLESIDKQIDQHGCLKDLLTSRRDLWKKLTDIDVNNGKDLAQKAKVKWAIEGDENSKFFHGIINKKGKKLAIRGDSVNGSFSKGCNPSFISLIPKLNDAKVVKDYRPISLIGCQYKIVGKILANRLSMVMDKLISKEQPAFIRDCQILDGPMILSEVIQWCNRKRKKSMIFEVDFKKAFDSVRWDFLDMILHSLVLEVNGECG